MPRYPLHSCLLSPLHFLPPPLPLPVPVSAPRSTPLSILTSRSLMIDPSLLRAAAQDKFDPQRFPSLSLFKPTPPKSGATKSSGATPLPAAPTDVISPADMMAQKAAQRNRRVPLPVQVVPRTTNAPPSTEVSAQPAISKDDAPLGGAGPVTVCDEPSHSTEKEDDSGALNRDELAELQELLPLAHTMDGDSDEEGDEGSPEIPTNADTEKTANDGGSEGAARESSPNRKHSPPPRITPDQGKRPRPEPDEKSLTPSSSGDDALAALGDYAGDDSGE